MMDSWGLLRKIDGSLDVTQSGRQAGGGHHVSGGVPEPSLVNKRSIESRDEGGVAGAVRRAFSGNEGIQVNSTLTIKDLLLELTAG